MASSEAPAVDPSNLDAFRAWDGADGAYWAEHHATFERALEAHEARVFDAAAVARADRVLDVGCGSGKATREAARRAAEGSATGVDLSSPMLARARQRAVEEGITNVEFLQADAQVHRFERGAFDVCISQTGTMFFGDPVAAFANIGRALRPGGRMVSLVWQSPERNEWFRSFTSAVSVGREAPSPPPGAPGPFSLADPDRVRRVLTEAGHRNVEIEASEEPMWFGDDAESAFQFVRRQGVIASIVRSLHDADQPQALANLRASIDAHVSNDGITYASAAWLVTSTWP